MEDRKMHEIYPKPPLVETVFEIKFSGEPSIDCHRDKFFNKIRKDYPKLMVPRAKEGVAIALEPYLFEKEDASYSIGLSINKLFLSCKKYQGFQVFKKEVLRVFAIFDNTFKAVSVLNRTGLRYINIIPFAREKGLIPLTSFLNINIALPESIPQEFKNVGISFVSQKNSGNITTRIEPVIAADKTEAIYLDFDYAKEGQLTFQSIEQYIKESHKHTKHFFEKLVTEDFKKIMRGEVI
jgi:uncharacterized protein (TIGR04255 family)